MECSDVKLALEKYHEFRKQRDSTMLKIEEVNAKRFKRGGSIAKIPENTMERSTMIINNLEKWEDLDESLRIYNYFILLGDHFINSLTEYKQLVIDKYVNKYSQTKLEMKYYMGKMTVKRTVDRLIERYLDVT